MLSSLVGLPRPYCELFPGRSRCRRQLRISGAHQPPLGSSPKQWAVLTSVAYTSVVALLAHCQLHSYSHDGQIWVTRSTSFA